LYAVRKANEPLHIMLNESNGHVMVINTRTISPSKLSARVRVFNLDGTQASETNVEIPEAKPCAATDVKAIDWPPPASPVQFVKLELYNRDNQVISDNFYWRASGPNGPEDLSALQTMPTTELVVDNVDTLVNGDQVVITANVSNPTKNVALQAHLQLRDTKTNARVLPAYYTVNYFSLLPGEKKSVTIQCGKADLKGGAPLLMIDGWNVSVAKRTFDMAIPLSVAPNTDALVAPKP